jgi:hypothetical protein
MSSGQFNKAVASVYDDYGGRKRKIGAVCTRSRRQSESWFVARDSETGRIVLARLKQRLDISARFFSCIRFYCTQLFSCITIFLA